MILGPDFFARPTLEVAPELIGAALHVRSGGVECAGRIVEVEAYLGEDDPASHAGRGRTPRSAIMFGKAGVAYVYLSYGVHHCLNFVTEEEGRAGAVLIRGLEPIAGRESMVARRGLPAERCDDRAISGGPGKLCSACGIDLDWNGRPLRRPAAGRDGLWVRARDREPGIAATPRIGIRRATERLYRFIEAAGGRSGRGRFFEK